LGLIFLPVAFVVGGKPPGVIVGRPHADVSGLCVLRGPKQKR
jgi:hypothetical protein